jgi:hypothetical protein
MWPFNRKKKERPEGRKDFPCTFCRSTRTMLMAYHGEEQPNPVRTWRGQRYLTFRCLDCGADFYVEEPRGGLPREVATDENIIDEDELKAAEDALKKQIDSENDRTLK